MKINIMRRALLVMASIVIAGIMPLSTASAQSNQERGKGDGLRVAYFNYAPFAYVDNNGDVVGEQVEILRYVLDKMGLKIASETATDWGNLIPGLKAGRFDIVAAGMFVTPKRCQEVAFTEPTFGIGQAFVVKKGNPDKLSDYASVRKSGVTMAAISGTAQVTWAKSAGIAEDKIMQVPDNATGLAAVKAGRAQAFAIDGPGARLAVENDSAFEALKSFTEVAGKPAAPHGAYAVRQSEGSFVSDFNRQLDRFIGSREHLAIMDKHGLTRSELPSRKTADLCKG